MQVHHPGSNQHPTYIMEKRTKDENTEYKLEKRMNSHWEENRLRKTSD